ncbi:hypothetical protein F5Y17DRAFT_454726 [Xylariaceae sp. FL0594]|nr:hypothetical protein F5Y17DRAFT_454726 [Xylariaceae sp. FL0594]
MLYDAEGTRAEIATVQIPPTLLPEDAPANIAVNLDGPGHYPMIEATLAY